MANNFSGDSNCKALWNMEEVSGDRADSIGSNTLTANIAQTISVTPRGNYCFAVTAYDVALNESSYSNEVCNDFKKQSSSPKTLVIQ